MKAISLVQPYRVELIDIPEPQLGPEDVLVDVHYVGLCGSDLSAYRGVHPLVVCPRVPGHEIGGIIVAKGSQVPERVEIGQHVTLSPHYHCGLCPACRSGRTNTCQFNQTLGVQRDGGLTARLAVRYSLAFPSGELSLRELALVEPMAVGYHAANRGRVAETDIVLVLGCGTVGMGVIAAAARKGATVVGADVDDGKLANARRFGAQHTINSTQEDVLAVIQGLTGGEGVSVAVEAVGLPETYRLAVDAVAYAGRVVFIGYTKKETTYDTSLFVRKELDILGSRNALRVFPVVIQMMERQERPFADLISRIYPFNESPRAYRDWDAAPGRFAKILIDVKA